MSENLNLKTISTIDPSPFKHLCVTIGELPSAFIESMSYYELLAWFVNYLENTVIPAVNANGEATAELQELFVELKDFVDNYFENLDVQEEINNKLDDMAEAGTLQEIITTYIQANVAWTFDNVSDMQSATNLTAGSYAQTLGFTEIGDGGGNLYLISDTGTPDNLNVFSVANDLYAIRVNKGVRKISLDELELVSDGVFTLGEVTVDSAIELPRQINRNIIIVDTVFNINTPILFPPYNLSSYFILPSFVGCKFNNISNSRVSITANGANTVGSRFVGCHFDNVDAIHDNAYVQDFNFDGCYIKSHTCFLDNPSGTIQTRMVNCTVEQESNQIVDADRLFGYFSGTYEGNVLKNFHMIETNYGSITLESGWLESVKFLHLAGEDNINKKSIINITDCHLNGYTDSTPQIYIDDGSFVEFYTSGSEWISYSQGSRFCNLTPSQFYKCTGSFAYAQAKSYTKEMGGENLYDYAVATEKYVVDIENKHFIHSEQKLTANVTNNMTLECGTYLAIMGRGAYGAVNNMHEYVISVSKTQNYAYATKILGGTDAYLDVTTFVPTKANAGDTTFNLAITSTTGYTLEVNLIRIS